MSLRRNYSHWTGNAEELAGLLTGILHRMDEQYKQPKPNERLIRHYVQQRILTRPEREGKAAYFGFQQIIEFLVARLLTSDGWPLAKVADFIRSSDLDELISMLPDTGEETDAQRVVAKLKSGSKGREPSRLERTFAQKPRLETYELEDALMERSADISKTRTASSSVRFALGTASPNPKAERVIRIALSDWCHVYVDPKELNAQSAEMPKWLGDALTHSLLEIRLGKGELDD